MLFIVPGGCSLMLSWTEDEFRLKRIVVNFMVWELTGQALELIHFLHHPTRSSALCSPCYDGITGKKKSAPLYYLKLKVSCFVIAVFTPMVMAA